MIFGPSSLDINKACRNLMYTVNKLRLYNRRDNLADGSGYRKRTNMAAVVIQ